VNDASRLHAGMAQGAPRLSRPLDEKLAQPPSDQGETAGILGQLSQKAAEKRRMRLRAIRAIFSGRVWT
jgi:hypothetical protein